MHSIQDYLKKINSHLGWVDTISLSLVALVLLVLQGYLLFTTQSQPITFIEKEGTQVEVMNDQASILPFASRNGTTYTFSWCKNAGQILAKNKIYFKDEQEAKNSGRTLSKLCGN